jgi:hypothetical protein
VAIAYASSTSFTEGNGTSVATVSKPSGTAVGDLLVAHLYIETAGVTEVIASTGDTWTLVHEHVSTASNPDAYHLVWVCVVANATSTIGVTWGGGSFWRDFAVHRFTGVDATTPEDVTATENIGSSTTATGLALASGTAGRHLVLCVANFEGRTHASWSSPLTERNDSGNLAMASGEDAAGTDTAAKSVTLSATSVWVAILLALRPAGGGPTDHPRSGAGAQPAATGVLDRLKAALRALAGAQPAASATLVRSHGRPRSLAGVQPAATGALASVRAYVRALAGVQPGASGTLTRVLAAVRSLAGVQPAAAGALTRVKAALRTLTGAQPSATGALTRLLAALRSLSGAQPAATGALTRSKANARALAGAQPAASATLAGQISVSRSVAGTQPAATGALTRTKEALRSLAGAQPGAAGTVARILAALRSLTGAQPAATGTLTAWKLALSWPDADVSSGGWTTQTGATTGLSLVLDEATADDADYVRSEPGPVADATVLSLAPLDDAGVSAAGSHRVRFRYSKPEGDAPRIDLTVTLQAGATPVATRTYQDIPDDWTEGVVELTPAEIADFRAAGGYADPRVELVAEEVA